MDIAVCLVGFDTNVITISQLKWLANQEKN